MKKSRLILGAVLSLVVFVVGGTWLYINVIEGEPAAELTLDDLATAPEKTGGIAPTTDAEGIGSPATNSIEGVWTATGESEVGYRVPKVLFGQPTEAVGRTRSVTGSMTISNTTIEAADFVVQMGTLVSDSSERDGQVSGRILETEKFPTSMFVLTSPIELGEEPGVDTDVSVTAIGDLTIKGDTKQVKLEMTARRTATSVSALARYTVVFDEWGIEDPSIGPAQVGPEGLLEIGLVFQR